jgi:flagellar biosynthetic protein FliR
MDFLGLTTAQIYVVLLILARVGALTMTAPVISSPRVPVQIKAAFSLVLTFVLYALAARHAPPAFDSLGLYFTLVMKEVLVGLVIGYTASLLFNVVQMAGEMSDNQAGFGFAGVVDPNMGQQAAILGQLQMVMMWLIFFAVDGHLLLIRGIGESFVAIPIGSFSYNPDLPFFMFGLATTLMMTALRIAAPIIGAVLLADMAMGMLQRTAPQLNLIAVGFQIKIGVALLVLLIALPLVVVLLRDLVGSIMATVHEIFAYCR